MNIFQKKLELSPKLQEMQDIMKKTDSIQECDLPIEFAKTVNNILSWTKHVRKKRNNR